MLDRALVYHEMTQIGKELFADQKTHLMTREQFTELGNQLHKETSTVDEYAALAVDGSQLYPHETFIALTRLLINAGACYINYNSTPEVSFFSVPRLIAYNTLKQGNSLRATIEQERDLYEFEYAYKIAGELLQKKEIVRLLLMDGSLYPSLTDQVLDEQAYATYQALKKNHKKLLQAGYQEHFYTVGYTSSSRSRALIEQLMHKHPDLTEQLKSITDRHLLSTIMQSTEYTDCMIYQDMHFADYDDALKPYFFYLHNGWEVVRITIPQWIASDARHIKKVVALCLDQSRKGFGYPVVLAHAHEQAVIKGPDQDFFYEMVTQEALSRGVEMVFSQKNIYKRSMIL